ncbi:hypothetical protein BGZ47_003216 [Haplosporangium gracile]|nr:hypothetical protein BGZ47_003216 [Haplosporangium gracile]
MFSKIASFEQDKEGVAITIGDITTVSGDILIGADGAHNAVRNHLYQTLEKQGLLPKSDTEAMSLLRSTGTGAVIAMQDAVLISNHIYDIKPTIHENIQTALNEHKEECFDAIKDQYPQAYIGAQLMYEHTLYERILRQVSFNWMPKSVIRKQLSKDTSYRPQADFWP